MGVAGYDAHKARAAKRSRSQSAEGRDIAPIPDVVNPERRDSCKLDYRRFCEIYFAAIFDKPWSDDHLDVIRTIEDAVLRGGLFAVAMPRASGKTSLLIAAAIWALLFGHRQFVVLIGASEDAAVDLLDHIKVSFETNVLLGEDFPEVCYPIRSLKSIVARAVGQLLNGEQTRIGWTAKEIVLPNVPNSLSSGSVIRVAGITGRIRGMSAQRPSDSSTIRPDFALVDDPQTDESAHSPQQVRRRMGTLSGAILGLSGPGEKITCFAAVTVIAKGDLADQQLDQKLHPEWQGRRIKLLKSLPTNIKLWEQYAEVRANSLRQGRGLKDATDFYLANQSAMDAGGLAAWPSRFNEDELSAIQHGMNLKLTDELSFAAEYQNEPLTLEANTPLLLKPEQVTAKIIAIQRGIVPAYATKMTAFIDVQGTVLFYAVVAWGNDFTGHVVDYGAYPDQGRTYFGLREVHKTLAMLKPHTAFEGYLYDGLEKLSGNLLSKQWQTEVGGDMRISRLMIDANWGDSTAVVKQFARESNYAALILASHGRGITADRKPLNDYQPRPGERTGWNWRIMPLPDRHILYDTNSWKTFVAQRICSANGEAGNLSIYQASPTQHRMIAEHGTAEYPTATEGGGRVVNVWKLRPGRENHLLDCLVGCAVGASEQGMLFVGHQPSTGEKKRPRRRLQVSF